LYLHCERIKLGQCWQVQAMGDRFPKPKHIVCRRYLGMLSIAIYLFAMVSSRVLLPYTGN